MKKLVSVLLIAVLALSLCTGAFADDPVPSITVTTKEDGIEYNAYKMFDVTYDLEKGAYSYTVLPAWKNFIVAPEGSTTAPAGAAYFEIINIAGIDYVQLKEGVTVENNSEAAAEIAKAALAYAEANNIAPAATGISAKANANEDGIISVVLNVGSVGYYVVDSSMGSLCMLDTNTPNVSIAEKNSPPPFEKEAEEPTISIGFPVHYTVTVEIAAGAVDYVVRDKMGTGLTYDENAKVYLKASKTAEEKTEVAAGNYTVYSGSTLPEEYEGMTFAIEFENSYLDTLEIGNVLVVEYTGTVNEDAVTRVHNDAWLDYGDKPYTEYDFVDTELLQFNIVKVDAASKEEKDGIITYKNHLAGATFKLYSDEECTKEISLIKDVSHITDPETQNYYRPVVESETAAEVIEVDENGLAAVYGLAEGIYYLKEVNAPDGYNKLKEPVEVVLEAAEEGEDPVVVEKVIENKSGAELPSTGGMGVTAFYVAGAVLLVSACVLFVPKKRVE